MEDPLTPQLLSLNETAERLGIGRSTTQTLIDTGQLRASDVATPGSSKRHLRIAVSDIEAFVASRAVRAKRSPVGDA